jgi:integrase
MAGGKCRVNLCLYWPGTKNDQDHRVWLPAAAQALLRDLDDKATTGFVFPGPRVATIGHLNVIMQAISKTMGVTDPIRPHDLRRTHGTMITKLGFGRDAMNRVQNHKEGGVTDVYDRHRYEDENKRIMETVAAHILALVNGETGRVIPLRA